MGCSCWAEGLSPTPPFVVASDGVSFLCVLLDIEGKPLVALSVSQRTPPLHRLVRSTEGTAQLPVADLAAAARNVFKLCLNPTSGLGGGGLEENRDWVLLDEWRTDWKGFTLYLFVVPFGEFITDRFQAPPVFNEEERSKRSTKVLSC